MNWIIRDSDKLWYHTNLKELVKPFYNELGNYNWVLSDLDFISDTTDLPINFDQDYFILSSSEFERLVSADMQIIWGAIVAVPKELPLSLNADTLPYVEGNDKIWENGNLQLPYAEIEIDCFDSSYTIIKFTSGRVSNQFKEYFPEAIELEKFK